MFSVQRGRNKARTEERITTVTAGGTTPGTKQRGTEAPPALALLVAIVRVVVLRIREKFAG